MPVSLWFPRPPTTPDERVLFEAVANTFTGWRSIGGRVTVADRRLLFTPHRLDGLTGGRSLAVERNDIRRVWMEARGREAVRKGGFGAAVRPQVGLEHPAGPTFFTVYHPEELLHAVQDGAESPPVWAARQGRCIAVNRLRTVVRHQGGTPSARCASAARGRSARWRRADGGWAG
jgi:hypothetical protein